MELGKLGSLADGLKSPRAPLHPVDHLTKILVFARDPVDSQEGALTCCLHQKAQYSEFVGWETPCEGWQAEAQCFGIAFVFHTQILNAAMISPETKMFPKLMLGSSSAPTELGAHSLDTAPDLQRQKRRCSLGPCSPESQGKLPCSIREPQPRRGVLSPPRRSQPSQLGVSERKQAAS